MSQKKLLALVVARRIKAPNARAAVMVDIRQTKDGLRAVFFFAIIGLTKIIQKHG